MTPTKGMPPIVRELITQIVQNEVAKRAFRDPTLTRDLPGLVSIAVEETLKISDEMSQALLEAVVSGKVEAPKGVDLEHFRELLAERKKGGKP